MRQDSLPVDRSTPSISVIIPVRNGAATLGRCLAAVASSDCDSWECIVVDDASFDSSADIARGLGARVIRVPNDGASGPARARNLGAVAATAPLLCFVDADVIVTPTTLSRYIELFTADPGLTAAFGSYDAEPHEPGLTSQYRNLVHHFVHQRAKPTASTFWAGCGAIRREVFLDSGGFDVSYTRPSVEDIELGVRLATAGFRIQLVKEIQVKHLKRWTLRTIIATDIRDRALPWSALIRRSRRLPDDLNLTFSHRLSALSLYAALLFFGLGCLNPLFWLAALLGASVPLFCNRDLYWFFGAKRGLRFLVGAIGLHWLYYFYSTAAFAVGWLSDSFDERRHSRIKMPG